MKLKSLFIALTVLSAGVVFAQNTPAKDELKLTPYIQVKGWVGNTQTSPAVGDSSSAFEMVALGTSRIGVKGEQGDVKMNVEFGSGSTTLRHAYVDWNFGAGNLLIGQTWTPYVNWLSTAAKDDFAAYNSALYDGRLPQVRLTVDNFYIVAVHANGATMVDYDGNGTTDFITAGGDNNLPKVALGYDLKIKDLGTFRFGAAYQKADVVNDSWFGYFAANLAVDKLTANINASYGVNTADFGLGYDNIILAGATQSVFGKDAKVIETGFDVGYTISPLLGLGAGATYQQADNGGTSAAKEMTYFGQLPITISKNFQLIPSVKYTSKMSDVMGDSLGSETIYGIMVIGKM